MIYTAVTRARRLDQLVFFEGPATESVKGCIYKLWSNTLNQCYIGSTLNFKERLKQHLEQRNDKKTQAHHILMDDDFQHETIPVKLFKVKGDNNDEVLRDLAILEDKLTKECMSKSKRGLHLPVVNKRLLED